VEFRLFHRFGTVESSRENVVTAQLYAVLERLRAAAPEWGYQPILDYARMCFWAIRKLEYSFAATSFQQVEAHAARPLRVLDVGCGVVPFCNWISQRGHEVTAIDPCEADIQFLSQHDVNKVYNSRVAYAVGRAEQLDFRNETFDVVTCVSVLEHLQPGNDRLALWEIARVLKPSGQLIITFDVSPPPGPEVGQPGWPADLRRYAQPFSPACVARLLGFLGSAYSGLADAVPLDLRELTWDDVHAFWRAAQAHDQRLEPERQYLAMGGVVTRLEQVEPVSETQKAAAYMEGQAALEEQLRFFQAHAQERLALIERLSREGELLQSQLLEKEQLIQELDRQARERLALLQQLSNQVESA
jgi:2-polyprenyl-3-methyl-5-hydroxy-6-metoxy-1,4-benzoquinol methylase